MASVVINKSRSSKRVTQCFATYHAVSEMTFMTRCYFSKTLPWLGLVFLVCIITYPKQHWPFLGYRKLLLSKRSFLSGLGCHMRLHWFARVLGSLISPSELFHCPFLVSAESVMCPPFALPGRPDNPMVQHTAFLLQSILEFAAFDPHFSEERGISWPTLYHSLLNLDNYFSFLGPLTLFLRKDCLRSYPLTSYIVHVNVPSFLQL